MSTMEPKEKFYRMFQITAGGGCFHHHNPIRFS